MPAVSVTGALYGDEGKGKVCDAIGEEADMYVKYQGGPNAGNTVVADGKEIVFHLLPAGAVRNKRCLVASGCVIHPQKIVDEVSQFDFDVNLGIDPRTHVIFPWHIALDIAREQERQKKTGSKIGTTAQGIGPCYEDSRNRSGIRFADLVGDAEALKKKIEQVFETKNKLLVEHYGFGMKAASTFGGELKEYTKEEIVAQYTQLGEKLRPFLADVSKEVRIALKDNKNVMFQGSQGALLDITFGNYPKVTSSHPLPSGVFTSVGIPPMHFEAIGLVKAYLTKVGSGPVVTCLDKGLWPVDESQSEDIAKQIRKEGAEFGATTGRPRRVAWQDLVLLKYACDLAGFTQLAVTKIDTLADLGPLKLCVAYEHNGEELTEYPAWDLDKLHECTPKYIEVPGFSKDELSNAKTYDELPEGAKKYLEHIEKHTGVPITIVSTSPRREDTIYHRFSVF